MSKCTEILLDSIKINFAKTDEDFDRCVTLVGAAICDLLNFCTTKYAKIYYTSPPTKIQEYAICYFCQNSVSRDCGQGGFPDYSGTVDCGIKKFAYRLHDDSDVYSGDITFTLI